MGVDRGDRTHRWPTRRVAPSARRPPTTSRCASGTVAALAMNGAATARYAPRRRLLPDSSGPKPERRVWPSRDVRSGGAGKRSASGSGRPPPTDRTHVTHSRTIRDRRRPVDRAREPLRDGDRPGVTEDNKLFDCAPDEERPGIQSGIPQRFSNTRRCRTTTTTSRCTPRSGPTEWTWSRRPRRRDARRNHAPGLQRLHHSPATSDGVYYDHAGVTIAASADDSDGVRYRAVSPDVTAPSAAPAWSPTPASRAAGARPFGPGSPSPCCARHARWALSPRSPTPVPASRSTTPTARAIG